MPDINLVSISPSQLSGAAEAGLRDVSAFQTKYLAQGDSWFSIGNIPPWSTTNLLQHMVLSRAGGVAREPISLDLNRNCWTSFADLPGLHRSTSRRFPAWMPTNHRGAWSRLGLLQVAELPVSV